jgi:ABC-2 type transport system permease protein
VSNIPFPLSLVSAIVPARYYILISRDAYVRGTGWPGVAFDVLVVLVSGLVLFAAARRSLGAMQLDEGASR